MLSNRGFALASSVTSEVLAVEVALEQEGLKPGLSGGRIVLGALGSVDWADVDWKALRHGVGVVVGVVGCLSSCLCECRCCLVRYASLSFFDC